MAEPCEALPEWPPRPRKPRSLRVRLEWQPADLWVGGFGRRTLVLLRDGARAMRYDVWVCLVPMLPLHISWVRRKR